jgi:CHAT domain-containing protein
MRELIFFICFIGPIRIYSQYDSELLIKQFDTICINNSFQIASQNIDKYPTSIKFVDLKDSFGIENLADLLFKNFELLDSLTKYEEAECVLGEIVKIHEFHKDTEMIATVMSVRTYYNYSKANNVYLAKILAEKTVHLYSLFSHKDTSLVNHLAMQQNTIYHSLGIKKYIPFDNRYVFFQIHQLVENGELKEADSLLFTLNYYKLNAEEKSDYLRYLMTIRFYTGDEIGAVEDEILKFIKISNDEAYTILFTYSMYKFEKNDPRALDFLLDFNSIKCLFETQDDNAPTPLSTEFCSLFTYLKGLYLLLVKNDKNGKNLILSMINDATYDLNKVSSFKSLAYTQIGDIYLGDNKIDSAIYCLNLAKQFYDENQNDIIGRDQIYYLSAKIDEYLGNLPGAILFYEKKIQQGLEYNFLTNIIQDKIKLAELNIKSLRYDYARNLLNSINISDSWSIFDVQYYTNVKAILLIEEQNYSEAEFIITKAISKTDKNLLNIAKTQSLYYDNKLTLIEIAVRSNNYELAKLLFDEVANEAYNSDEDIFTNSGFILYLGLGYRINKVIGNNENAATIKGILEEEMQVYNSNEYRNIVVLINILGLDSELFDQEFLSKILEQYLYFYGIQQMSPYEAEYGNKIYYYYLKKYNIKSISYNSKLSRHIFDYQDSKYEENRYKNLFLYSTMRLNNSTSNFEEKSNLLMNTYHNYVSSTFGNLENELLTKILDKEALIRIVTYRIDNLNYYLAFVFQRGIDSISVLFLNNFDEKRVINEFQKVLDENDLISSKYIYETIWRPFEIILDDINKLTIIPSGVYSYINLNVIKNKESQYLVDQYTYIQYLFSLRGLSYQNIPFNNDLIYFIGNPSYSGLSSDNSFKGHTLLERSGNESGNWISLPNTQLEVENNVKVWNSNLTKVLLDTIANEENFHKIESPRILHIATHGFANQGQNDFDAGFVLANANLLRTSERNDGYVYARDISSMDFAYTELVTLSMCESGIGSNQLYSAISSLCNSFIVAGASNVMYSVVKVNDESTKYFMNSFYQYYSNSLNPTYSISKTMREIKEQFELPKYWGGFVLMTTSK